MSRIFISGSSTGLGLMAADLLVSKGHSVVLHARNAKRAEAVRQEVTQTEAIVVGDVETISGAKEVAAQVNALGHFDTVIHNAAVGYREGHRVTADGLPHVFAINNAVGLYPDRADRAAQAARLSELRDAPRGQPGPRGPAVAPTAMGRLAGVLGLQTVRCGARLCRRSPLARGVVQRTGTRLGSDQDGWAWRT